MSPEFFYLKSEEQKEGEFNIVDIVSIRGDTEEANVSVICRFTGKFKELADKLFGKAISRNDMEHGVNAGIVMNGKDWKKFCEDNNIEGN